MAEIDDFWWLTPTGIVPPNGLANEHQFAGFRHHARLPLLLRREHFVRGVHTNYDHHLDFYALYLVRSGAGVHRINGTPYGLARGDVYLMPPGALHAYENWENMEIDAFYFAPTLFETEELAALRELPGFWNLFLGAPTSSHRLHLAPESWRSFEGDVQELGQEYETDENAAALVLRSGVFRLLVRLGRQARANVGLREMAPSREWAALLSWMEEHCAQPLSVAQLAGRCFLSPRQFTEQFARETGQSPHAYLRRLRLEKARALLQESPLSITRIASETGFGDSAHFSRVFKACYGLSPREFRSQFGR